jgi:hypothetical protein
MRSIFDFVITPQNKRYNNTKKISDVDLIVNTEIQNHKFISQQAKVLYTPTAFKTNIKPGDDVIVHHNIFRRWRDVHGQEKNSKSFIDEQTYLCQPDQLYLYKQNNKWKTQPGYCFVKPIKNTDKYSLDKEQPLIGIVKYAGDDLNAMGLKENDLVGFSPHSEFEFVVDNERLYRVLLNSITIKYEYQGQEEEYNPSWLQSG